MANYQNLESIIATKVYENERKEVSAEMLRQALFAMVSSLGTGYQFMGLADRLMDPGRPDQKVCYFTMTAGNYYHFDRIDVAPGELAFLCFDGNWQKKATSLPFVEVVLTEEEYEALRDAGELDPNTLYFRLEE